MVFGEGAPRAVDKASAEIAFNEVIRDLADAASGKRLLVENVGHYSLLPRDGRNYLSGPLDHFFPWEIARFRDFVRQAGFDHVEPFVAVAPAALSSHLFNRKRVAYSTLRDAPRFALISEENIQAVEVLHPYEFLASEL